MRAVLKNLQLPVETIPADEPQPFIYYDALTKTSDGTKFRNIITPGTFDGTITPAVVNDASAVFGRSMKFDRALSCLNAGDVNSLDGAAAFTFEFVFRSADITGGNQNILGKYNSATNSIQVFYGSTGLLSVFVANGASSRADTPAATIRANTNYHVVIVYDGAGATNADKLKIYVNGEAKVITFTNNMPATSGSNAQSLFIGARDASTTPANAAISYFRAYASALSATSALRRYQQYAKALLRMIVVSDAATTAAITGAGTGVQVPGTAWAANSGSWLVTTDSTKNVLKRGSTAAADAWSPFNQAFGSWKLDRIKQDASGQVAYLFVSDTYGWTAGATNGYALRITSAGALQLVRYSAGVATSLGATADAFISTGVAYDFWVSRRETGVFRVFYRVTNSVQWLPIAALSQTDATHLSSVAFVMQADALAGVNQLGDVSVFAGPSDPITELP